MPDGGNFIVGGADAPVRPTIIVRELAPARWVKQEVFEVLTGYTVSAQKSKCTKGVWPRWDAETGRGVWIVAEDGNRLMSLDGYYSWVEGRKR
jgi:hypothetical protein